MSSRMRMMYPHAVIALATAMSSVVASSALAREPAHTQEASFHDPGALGFTNHHLDCTAPSRGCAYAFDGTTVETGDLVGTTTYHGLLYPGDGPSRTVRWDVVERFTGKIAGCGRGSVQWSGSGYGDITSFDPSAGSARMWGTLTMIPGSGTRGLRGITGTLTVEAQASAVPPGAQDGTFTGDLICAG